jgi:formylglycine-generating enzyme required for sulfatase activity
LEHAEEAWRKAGRDRDQLLRGGRLEQAIRWKQRNAGELRTQVEEFVEASRRRRRFWRAVRWGSILTVTGLLFLLALPTITSGLREARADLAGRGNQKDGLRYVYIRSGEFQMGCGSDCSGDDDPPHLVRITKEFWIGQTEVTQAAYARVMKGAHPSNFKGDNLPVEFVSWNEADAYCHAVDMRLPTEAEWEYAARAGNTNERYGDIDKIAVYGSGPATVRSKAPNAWGLYDMLGNVGEWTNDWYDKDYYKNSPKDDPPGPSQTLRSKVVRGGSWYYNPLVVRVSVRDRSEPSFRDDGIGFRCAGDLR